MDKHRVVDPYSSHRDVSVTFSGVRYQFRNVRAYTLGSKLKKNCRKVKHTLNGVIPRV